MVPLCQPLPMAPWIPPIPAMDVGPPTNGGDGSADVSYLQVEPHPLTARPLRRRTQRTEIMTANDLADKLADDIRRIEAESLRKNAHRRMVVHVMNETLRWGAERLENPQPQEEDKR